ncbi:MAG: hypothetical protein KIT45_06500 [Fimbriimonadia bacterium]|nr:hypothetical protein [Fimbriimonadia bacterium]
MGAPSSGAWTPLGDAEFPKSPRNAATARASARRQQSFPIPFIPMEQQLEYIKLVENILQVFDLHGHPLPEDAASKVKEWELEIDRKVEKLYESPG